MTLKKLKKLSPEIYELAKLRKKEYCIRENIPYTYLDDEALLSSFGWSKTEEGRKFWGNVHNGILPKKQFIKLL